MSERRNWTRDELLLAFRLYCELPFGRLYAKNPEIIELARKIGRTPNALAMKACNLASLDPFHQRRGVKGLSGASKADRQIWQEFHKDWTALFLEAEEAEQRLAPARKQHPEPKPYLALADELAPYGMEPEQRDGPTEIERTVRARRVQSFFRQAVLVSYQERCAISGLAVPQLLNASHIIPWSKDESRRADPRNGIALNTLYDRAFDRGLITFDKDLRLIVSRRLDIPDPSEFHRRALIEVEGTRLQLPNRFHPDPEALEYHREHVFAG